MAHGIVNFDGYRHIVEASQKGKIGITIVTNWYTPKNSSSVVDQKAAKRQLDFVFGWFADPITKGDYPEVMKALVGYRLPKFTKEETQMLKGSFDFIGVNYYTTNYVAGNPLRTTVNLSYSTDSQNILSTDIGGVPIGTPTPLSWLFVYPTGIYDLALYIRDKYYNPPVYFTENGIATENNASLSLEENLKDGLRINYHYSHLKSLLQAIKKGANVKGYYAWSFFDDFEWDAGFSVRFGLVYVDYKNKVKRYLKYSAYWLKMFLLK